MKIALMEQQRESDSQSGQIKSYQTQAKTASYLPSPQPQTFLCCRRRRRSSREQAAPPLLETKGACGWVAVECGRAAACQGGGPRWCVRVVLNLIPNDATKNPGIPQSRCTTVTTLLSTYMIVFMSCVHTFIVIVVDSALVVLFVRLLSCGRLFHSVLVLVFIPILRSALLHALRGFIWMENRHVGRRKWKKKGKKLKGLIQSCESKPCPLNPGVDEKKGEGAQMSLFLTFCTSVMKADWREVEAGGNTARKQRCFEAENHGDGTWGKINTPKRSRAQRLDSRKEGTRAMLISSGLIWGVHVRKAKPCDCIIWGLNEPAGVALSWERLILLLVLSVARVCPSRGSNFTSPCPLEEHPPNFTFQESICQIFRQWDEIWIKQKPSGGGKAKALPVCKRATLNHAPAEQAILK